MESSEPLLDPTFFEYTPLYAKPNPNFILLRVLLQHSLPPPRRRSPAVHMYIF